MTHPIHHVHKRKRVHNQLETYPHPHTAKRVMDRVIYVVGILGPIMSIPQIMKVWVEQNPGGISVISYTSYAILDVFWVIYGIMHKEKPIIIVYILWTLINTSIVIGTLLYS